MAHHNFTLSSLYFWQKMVENLDQKIAKRFFFLLLLLLLIILLAKTANQYNTDISGRHPDPSCTGTLF